jgi:putative hydrolase of the HAD superfamily
MVGARAVLFDLWHTLVYLEPDEEERYMAAQLETVAEVLGRWPPSPRARHPPTRDAHRVAEEIRADAVTAAAQGVSTPLAVQAVHGARRLGRKARPLELLRGLATLVEQTAFRLSPGVLETLEELQARQFHLGVVSNTLGEPGEAWQRKMDRAGLGRYIEGWAFSDQLPWTKPAPEIFWHVLGVLGTSKERAVHVGDGWSDIAGARAAGLRAGILYTGAQRYGESYRRLFAPKRPELDDASHRVDRLADVPGLAENLLSP